CADARWGRAVAAALVAPGSRGRLDRSGGRARGRGDHLDHEPRVEAGRAGGGRADPGARSGSAGADLRGPRGLRGGRAGRATGKQAPRRVWRSAATAARARASRAEEGGERAARQGEELAARSPGSVSDGEGAVWGRGQLRRSGPERTGRAGAG